MMLKLSKLPLESHKTFANFNFDEGHGKSTEQLRGLQALSTLYSHRNIALIGPVRTGKPHIVMAYGCECCQQKLKTYFVTMTERNTQLSLMEAAVSGRLTQQ